MRPKEAGVASFRRYERTGEADDLEQAIICFRSALRQATSQSLDHLDSLNNLAAALVRGYERLGRVNDLDEAIGLLECAVGLKISNPVPRVLPHSNLASALELRFHRTGNTDDLRAAGRFAWEAVQLAAAAEHPARATSLHTLASVWLDIYEVSNDRNALARAISTFEDALKITAPSERATRFGNLGNAHLLWFEQYGDADGSLEKAITNLQQAVDLTPDTSAAKPRYLANLGAAYKARYPLHRAPVDLERAFQLLRRACELARDRSAEVVLTAGVSWAGAACAVGDWPDAVDACTHALAAIDRLVSAQLSRRDKEAWLRDSQRLPMLAAYAFSKNGDVRGAVVALEHARSRLLADVLERNRADLEALIALGYDDLYREYRALADRIADLEYVGIGQSGPIPSPVVRDLTAAHSRFAEIIERIRAVPGYEDLFRPPDFEQIRRCVITEPEHAAVYLVAVSGGLFAIILHQTGVEHLWLDIPIVERDLIVLLRDYFRAQSNPATFRRKLASLLTFFGVQVMQPVCAAVNAIVPPGPQRRLTLIPTGRLASLPLHAAALGDGPTSKFVLDDFVIRYAPSALVLRRNNDQRLRVRDLSPRLFAISNPQPLPQHLPSLEFSALETFLISQHFDGRRDEKAGANANVSAVNRGLEAAEYIHLSCHGQFDAARPLESGLFVATGQKLLLKDLMAGRRLRHIRLAVLSACQTGIADFETLPEEVLGLPAGFLQAGTSGVVGTLWMVNEVSTALLMDAFYRYHCVGDVDAGIGPLDPAPALRAAQVWLRDATNERLGELFGRFRQTVGGNLQPLVQRKYREFTLGDPTKHPFSDPYHWAPFTFHGE